MSAEVLEQPVFPVAAAAKKQRWLQLLIGVVCMAMIANLQYGWTLFVVPLDQKYHWGRQAIQVAFTIFVVTETFLVPVEGYLVDRFGPRLVVMGGGLLVGVAWVMNAFADSLTILYAAAALGGIGAGAIYGTCVGNALKWFADRRGLAAGLTAAGFGMGSAATIIPISMIIKSSGYEAAFLYFGIGQGLVVFLLSFLLSAPNKETAEKEQQAAPRVAQTSVDFTWSKMVKTPVFWVMYLMFFLMAVGGLVATAQLAPIAKDFKIAEVPVSLMGLTLPALAFALSLDRIFNGLTRPFFGWVSDYLGRENTMFIAFGIEAVGIYALSIFGQDPVLFVILSGVVFFGWGEIYSLFPSVCGDTFGARYATTNAGLLYTAKGVAALVVPYTSVLASGGNGWHLVFYIAAGMNAIAALMALGVLKPMRSRMRNLQKASEEFRSS